MKEMRCGCSFWDRLRVHLKPYVALFSLDQYEDYDLSKAVPTRGEHEKDLILSALEWGHHMRERPAIASTGDTIVVADEGEIIVATIRRNLVRKEKE